MSFVLLSRSFPYIYHLCHCLPDKGYHVKKVVDTIRVPKKIPDKKKEGSAEIVKKENDV